MPWDTIKAVAALDGKANLMSSGRCPQFTRNAIEAGGLTLQHHTSAKDYGNSLTAVGFVAQATAPTVYQAGDVGIVQAIPGHPHGHMARYDGKQ